MPPNAAEVDRTPSSDATDGDGGHPEEMLEKLTLAEPGPSDALRDYAARMVSWTKERYDEAVEDAKVAEREAPPHTGSKLPRKAKTSSPPKGSPVPVSA